MRRAAGRLGAAVIVLACAACSAVAGDSGLSKHEFVQQADAICRRHNRTIDTFGADDPGDPVQLSVMAKRVLSEQERELAALRKLSPPSADARSVRDWLDHVDAAIAASRALVDAVAGNDPAAVDRAKQRARQASDAADGFARAYGVRACVST